MKEPSALIVGAGIGGIATAARLAQHGYRVTVVEKNEKAGGRCDQFVKDGHYFDTGPTLFLMREIFAQTFDDLGENLEDYLDLRRIDPTYHIRFEDGSTLALTSDLSDMRDQLEAIEPGSFGGYLRYLDEGYRHYGLSLKHLVQRNFRNPLEFFNFKTLWLVLKLKALIRHYHNVGRYFKDQRLRMAFTFQDMYVGLSPYKAPAIYSFLSSTELTDGVWLPVGGMYSVIEALTGIAQKWGVQFQYNTPVEQINVKGRQATGVTLANGQQIQADVVVANADLPYVYRELLPHDGMAVRLERKKYTCSTVTFCWGVDKQYPQLEAHNLFVTGDDRQSFERIIEDCAMPDKPNFYVHAPTRVDASMAPEDHDTLTVVVPVGHINDNTPQDWGARQKQARQFVLRRLAEIGITDLEEHLKFERTYCPPYWRSRYNLVKGATHGLSHNLTQMAYLRPRNRHDRYGNLYFVGASTHPGTGLPTILVSARLVTERILQDSGTSKEMKSVVYHCDYVRENSPHQNWLHRVI